MLANRRANVLGGKSVERKDGLIVDVYWAKIPDEIGKEMLFPLERQNEVLACGNEKVRMQKYYAWKLLKYALRESFGYEMERLSFCKEKNGKWTSPSCYFSISHSHDAVAVAVGNAPIGVDLEKIASEKAEFLQKTLTEQERAEFALLFDENERVEYLFESWTKKESFFKRVGDGAFRPSKIAVDKGVVTKSVTIDGERYVLSLAAESVAAARYFFDVDFA